MKTQEFPYHSDIGHYFTAFSSAEYAFLFDSGQPEQEQGQIDIFSAWPTEVIKSNGSDIAQVKQRLSKRWQSNACNLAFSGGWMGFASYELSYALEPKSGQPISESPLPLFFAAYYPWAFIVDHEQNTAQLVYEESIDKDLLIRIQQHLQIPKTKVEAFKLNAAFKPLTSWAQYQKNFQHIQNYLMAGDCYQVNYAQAYQSNFTGHAYGAYQQLRQAVPSPFMAYAHIAEHTQILSISPERFLKACGSQLETKPIKGTAARSSNKEIDEQIALSLQQCEKNRAENLMIVDLLRNDFGHHCETGSIKAKELFTIASFTNVHHLVSSITGTIQSGKNIWDVFFSAFPGGSITGAPKIRACKIINALETQTRDIYCGSLFYASNNGRFDSNIAIRTLLANNNVITAWAGGGIVKDSNAIDEYQECQHKIGKLLRSLED